MNWFLAALVPGLVSLIVVPFIIYKIYPPTVKETPNAKSWAENELATMGKIALAEKIYDWYFCHCSNTMDCRKFHSY